MIKVQHNVEEEEKIIKEVEEVESEKIPHSSNGGTKEVGHTTETQKDSKDSESESRDVDIKNNEQIPVGTESVPNENKQFYSESVELKNEINTDNLNVKDESSSSELKSETDQEIILEPESKKKLNNDLLEDSLRIQKLAAPEQRDNIGAKFKSEDYDYDEIVDQEEPYDAELDKKPGGNSMINNEKLNLENYEPGFDRYLSSIKEGTTVGEDPDAYTIEEEEEDIEDDIIEDDDVEDVDLSTIYKMLQRASLKGVHDILKGAEKEQARNKASKEMDYMNADFEKETDDLDEDLEEEKMEGDEAFTVMMDSLKGLTNLRESYKRLHEEHFQRQKTLDEKKNDETNKDMETLDQENERGSGHFDEMNDKNGDNAFTLTNSVTKNEENLYDNKNIDTENVEKVEPEIELNSAPSGAEQVDSSLDWRASANSHHTSADYLNSTPPPKKETKLGKVKYSNVNSPIITIYKLYNYVQFINTILYIHTILTMG